MGLGQVDYGPPTLDQTIDQLPTTMDPTTAAMIGVTASGSVVPTSLPSSSTLSSQLSASTSESYLLIGGAILFVFLLMLGKKR